ncbi:hypothetical protein PsYK624_166000 [Phanerochaete sordida]|uniref:Uncharacterized protein n=1 Tax=Phanerochaete sordida TaxID=48140 RepID=A0A9P3LN84_9APHY|nr:hypothetical protein PsYK624_166000 [Phanerochaete sordida]
MHLSPSFRLLLCSIRHAPVRRNAAALASLRASNVMDNDATGLASRLAHFQALHARSTPPKPVNRPA